MKISSIKTSENPNYLGYDEDHDGNFGDYFMCSACKKNNYITLGDTKCDLCLEPIEWTSELPKKCDKNQI